MYKVAESPRVTTALPNMHHLTCWQNLLFMQQEMEPSWASIAIRSLKNCQCNRLIWTYRKSWIEMWMPPLYRCGALRKMLDKRTGMTLSRIANQIRDACWQHCTSYSLGIFVFWHCCYGNSHNAWSGTMTFTRQQTKKNGTIKAAWTVQYYRSFWMPYFWTQSKMRWAPPFSQKALHIRKFKWVFNWISVTS